MGSTPRKPRAKSPSKVGQGKHPQKHQKITIFRNTDADRRRASIEA